MVLWLNDDHWFVIRWLLPCYLRRNFISVNLEEPNNFTDLHSIFTIYNSQLSFKEIHSERLCCTQFSTRIYWNRGLTAFFICWHNKLSFTHSIAMYRRLQMFEKGDSWNRHKMNHCPVSASFMAKFELVLDST